MEDAPKDRTANDQPPSPGSTEPEVSPATPPPIPPDDRVNAISDDDRMFAMFAHLSPIMLSFIGPLIILLVKKEQSTFVAREATEALNFQLTLLIGYTIAFAVAVWIATGGHHDTN